MSTRASWYGLHPSACYDRTGRHRFPAGLRMFTAHKTLPCGTLVVVEYGGKSITVPVWDRGPYVTGRELDLSTDAFVALAGSTKPGVIRVRYRRA